MRKFRKDGWLVREARRRGITVQQLVQRSLIEQDFYDGASQRRNNYAKSLIKRQEGGPIVDPMGQWNHPYQETIVPTEDGKITMQGIPYPVLGIDDTGMQQMMYPNQEYQFRGKNVYETPMMQAGGTKPLIFISDKVKFDKKNKDYQDSLALYNASVATEKLLRETSNKPLSEKIVPFNKIQNSIKDVLPNAKPIRTEYLENNQKVNWFKKPVQPYSYFNSELKKAYEDFGNGMNVDEAMKVFDKYKVPKTGRMKDGTLHYNINIDDSRKPTEPLIKRKPLTHTSGKAFISNSMQNALQPNLNPSEISTPKVNPIGTWNAIWDDGGQQKQQSFNNETEYLNFLNKQKNYDIQTQGEYGVPGKEGYRKEVLLRRKPTMQPGGRFFTAPNQKLVSDNTQAPINTIRKTPLTAKQQAYLNLTSNNPQIVPAHQQTIVEQQANARKKEQLQKEYVDGKSYASIQDGRINIDENAYQRMQGVDNLSKNLEVAEMATGLGALAYNPLKSAAKRGLRQAADAINPALNSIEQGVGSFYHTKLNPLTLDRLNQKNLKYVMGENIAQGGVNNYGVYALKGKHLNPYLAKLEDPEDVANVLGLADDYLHADLGKDFSTMPDSENIAKIYKSFGNPRQRAQIMNRISGKNIHDLNPMELRKIPQESYTNFMSQIGDLKKRGFGTDYMGSNIVYNPSNKKFGAYDLLPEKYINDPDIHERVFFNSGDPLNARADISEGLLYNIGNSFNRHFYDKIDNFLDETYPYTVPDRKMKIKLGTQGKFTDAILNASQEAQFKKGGEVGKKLTKDNPYINYKKVFNLALGELYPKKPTGSNRMMVTENGAPSMSQMRGNPYKGMQKGGSLFNLFDRWDEEDSEQEIPENTAPTVEQVQQGFTQEDLDYAERRGQNKALALQIAMEEVDPNLPNTQGSFNVPQQLRNGPGQYGTSIIQDVSSRLGYTPKLNSVFRSPEKQRELINQGVGVENSWHLTGDAIDMKPADWNKLSQKDKTDLKQKYDVVYHNNHYHIEPKGKRTFKTGGVYDLSPEELSELKRQGYEFTIKY